MALADRIARTWCWAGGLALALAGCAAAPPPDPRITPATCDLICRMLRLFEGDAPPPVSLLPPVPAPLARPRTGHAEQRGGHGARLARLEAVPLRHLVDPQPAAAAPEADRPEASPPQSSPAEASTEPRGSVPDLPPEQPARRESGLQRRMAGSPAIAPPWFEPWPTH